MSPHSVRRGHASRLIGQFSITESPQKFPEIFAYSPGFSARFSGRFAIYKIGALRTENLAARASTPRRRGLPAKTPNGAPVVPSGHFRWILNRIRVETEK